jgi:hypothetical protein
MNTASDSCKPESGTDTWTGRPSSETSEAPISDQWPDWWISSLADSLAKTCRSPALVMESKVNEAAYGHTWREQLAKFDPHMFSWRTLQLSLEGELAEFSETWPRSGMTLSGIAYRRLPPVPPSCETESGYWPTPMVPNGGRGIPKDALLIGRSIYTQKGRKVQLDLREAVKRWPTPSASQNRNRAQKPSPAELEGRHGMSLRGAVLLSEGIWNDKVTSGRVALDMDSLSGSHQESYLNPDWVETLMGLPLGWTALEPVEMESYRRWWQSFCGEAPN